MGCHNYVGQIRSRLYRLTVDDQVLTIFDELVLLAVELKPSCLIVEGLGLVNLLPTRYPWIRTEHTQHGTILL